jgi:hypothetical protein
MAEVADCFFAEFTDQGEEGQMIGYCDVPKQDWTFCMLSPPLDLQQWYECALYLNASRSVCLITAQRTGNDMLIISKGRGKNTLDNDGKLMSPSSTYSVIFLACAPLGFPVSFDLQELQSAYSRHSVHAHSLQWALLSWCRSWFLTISSFSHAGFGAVSVL